MRLAVLGSGGIGGYYGALLAKAGNDVSFIARGAHLEAMQQRGLTLRTPDGDYEGRRALVRADVDDGLEGSPHSRQRSEPRLHRHPRTQ